MTIINHDGFEGEEIPLGHDNYNIVYGSKGWTDALDDATIELLTLTGVIRLYTTYTGVYNHTRVYVSIEGKEPKR